MIYLNQPLTSFVRDSVCHRVKLDRQVRLAMQNQFSPRSSSSLRLSESNDLGEVGSAVSSSSGPVQGGGLNTPPASSKNFIFRHKRLVGAIVLAGLILTAAIVIASSVFFKKPQSAEQEVLEPAPFDVNTINKDSDLPQTGGE